MAMEGLSSIVLVLEKFVCPFLQSLLVETAIVAAKSLTCLLFTMGCMPNGINVLPREPSTFEWVSLADINIEKQPNPENKDASEMEDEDEDTEDDQDDDAGDEEDEFSGEEENDGEAGDSEDDPAANSYGGSEEDEDDDDDDDDDDEEEDEDEDEDEDEEEEEDEGIAQPPAKKKK